MSKRPSSCRSNAWNPAPVLAKGIVLGGRRTSAACWKGAVRSVFRVHLSQRVALMVPYSRSFRREVRRTIVVDEVKVLDADRAVLTSAGVQANVPLRPSSLDVAGG